MATLYEKYNTDDSSPDSGGKLSTYIWWYQVFTVTSAHTISSIKVLLNTSVTAGTFVLKIFAVSSGQPTGSVLQTSAARSVPDTDGDEMVEFTFSSPFNVDTDEVYCWVLDGTNVGTKANVEVQSKNSNVYAGGICGIGNDGSTWTPLSTADLYWEVWGGEIGDGGSSIPIFMYYYGQQGK